MAQCVIWSGGVLVADPAPVSSCTGFVLATPEEFSAMGAWFAPLSIEDGALIGTAVFGAWAVAFAFRMMRNFLDSLDWRNTDE